MADYPKRISELVTSTIIDETGFTESEKFALSSGWRIIHLKLKRHAVNIYLDFYATYPKFLKLYIMENGVFNLVRLNMHTYQILEIIGDIIESLSDSAKVNAILFELVKSNGGHLGTNDVKLLLGVIKTHLKKILIRYASPTLHDSFNKLGKLIVNAFQLYSTKKP